MDFIEAKNASAREIALAIGVPPLLLGIPGDNTYANYAEAQRAFWRQTVLPLVHRTARALSNWLASAFETKPALGGRLRGAESPSANIRHIPDLDQIEALAPERDALWKRLEAASFLTDDEKRAAAGYGAKRETETSLKYRADQPRVPAGNSGGGQWTDGSAAGGSGSDTLVGGGDADRLADRVADPVNRTYSPDQTGFHKYKAGPNLGCDSDLQCSPEEAADHFSRFAVPGQDPSRPVRDGDITLVRDPETRIPVGYVRTQVSRDGLTITNWTLKGHIFHDGEVIRRMRRASDGSWLITTDGLGNNVIPGANVVNQTMGPKIFDELDRRLLQNVRLHHARQAKSR
jgi:hypothetical protein